MNIRDLLDFDPTQWSYVGGVAEMIDEGFAVDADPSKRGFLASRIAPLYEAVTGVSTLAVIDSVPKFQGYNLASCIGIAYCVAHIGLAIFSLYEGESWSQILKEGLTAPISAVVTPFATLGFAFVDGFAGLASLAIPTAGRLVRSIENSMCDWSQRQINMIEGTEKSYERRWTLQPKGDLLAEGLAAAILNSTYAVYNSPSLVVSAPWNLVTGGVCAVAGGMWNGVCAVANGSWSCFKAITT